MHGNSIRIDAVSGALNSAMFGSISLRKEKTLLLRTGVFVTGVIGSYLYLKKVVEGPTH